MKRFLFLLVLLVATATLSSCGGVKINIHFDTGGGTEIESITTDGVSTINIPTDPEKEDFVFDGWYWDEGTFLRPFTANSLLDEPISSDLTVYAKWVPESLLTTYFEVTFDVQGGSSIDSQSILFRHTVIEPVAPIRLGYLFAGWYLDQNYTEEWNFITDNVESNLTLYAKWSVIVVDYYVVQFVSNCDIEIPSQQVLNGSTLTAPNMPTREGFSLDGWYTSLNNGDTLDEKWSFVTNNVNSNITLYAKWNINNYIITFESNGGSLVEPLVLEHNSNLNSPLPPTKDKHTFAGWYFNQDLTDQVIFPLNVVESKTLYAKWNFNYAILPDLSGESRESISTILTNLGLTVRFYFDVSVIYDEETDYDKFVKYGSLLVPGNEVPLGSEVKVYTTPLNLTVKYLYELDVYEDTLGNPLLIDEARYQGQEFIEDGVGVVTVERYVDGDTTWFRSGSITFSVRYLGIDTPESTALYEPWGKAAAKYTEEKLKNAETIVLESEGERMDGNGRYLAWVWYRDTVESDFVLLNLELVELAYSKNKVAIGSKFITILTLADWDASLTKRRVWGEIDPAYDYSKEGTQMSIEYLMANFDQYVGLKVVVSGTITRMIGNNIYLQDLTGYGVYMYAGYTSSAQLQVGANVTIGGLVPTYYSGSPQLSNFNKLNLSVNETIVPPTPITITYDDFTFAKIGTLVEIHNLTISYINAAKTSVTVKDSLNRTFVVRIDDSTGFTAETLGLTVDDVISVIGPLGYYDYDFDGTDPYYVYLQSNFQLMLTDVSDITVH